MHSLFLATVAILSSVHFCSAAPATLDYSCNSTLDISKNFTKLAIPIIQSSTYYNVSTWNNVTNVTEITRQNLTISGTVTMLDPCSFELTNFTYTPFVADTVWYGKQNGTFTIGKQVSNWSILPVNTTQPQLHYQLMDGVTFENIDTLIIYSPFHETQLAYVQFPRSKSVKQNETVHGITNGNSSYWDYSSSASFAKPSSISMVIAVLVAFVIFL